MGTRPDRCTSEHYLVKLEQIHYLRFTLEAYEGIATVTTRDASLGWVQIYMAPGAEDQVRRVLDSERERLGLLPMFEV